LPPFPACRNNNQTSLTPLISPLSWEEAGEAPCGGEIELYTGTTDNPDDHVPTLHIWHD
jgi:hypothetical protein